MKFTRPQLQLLWQAKRSIGFFTVIHGTGEARVARSLEKLGLGEYITRNKGFIAFRMNAEGQRRLRDYEKASLKKEKSNDR